MNAMVQDPNIQKPQVIQQYGGGPPGRPLPPQTEGASGLSIGAFILGLMGTFCCLSIFGAIPAIIMGWIEKNRINQGSSSQRGYGFAVAGMVLGFIHVAWLAIIFLFYLIYGLALLATLGGQGGFDSY